MLIIIFLIIAEAVLLLTLLAKTLKDIVDFVFVKYKIAVFRFFVKLKYSYYDYAFMTNLSMGVFAGSLVAIVVTKGVYSVAYMVMAIASFIAMIDYNYKK